MAIHAREALLEPKPVGEIAGMFYVPGYQRGFRWGRLEVRRLLDDIRQSWEQRDDAYYLQPVVVKRYGGEWELVDGQQRLTTLFLILQYMKNEGLQKAGAGYSLRYETREGSAEYLQDVDPAKSQDNIDFFHIAEAYRCIEGWFEEFDEGRRQWAANRLYEAFYETVKVIWYEAADEVDATTLFTRLNVGRIPLTDAELVKALVLSQSRAGSVDRSFEMAAQWDAIERDLRQPELWASITAKARPEPTHISLLLDMLADQIDPPSDPEHRPNFHTFETLRDHIVSDPEAFWNDVIDLHSLVLGWHESRDLFHKVGYLVAQKRKLGHLISLSRGRTKSEFDEVLDSLISETLNLTESQVRELTYTSRQTPRALLLMNVETIRQRRHSSERYSFREHAAGRWSLEHIHAQNAEQLPRRTEVWDQWLRLHRRALEAFDEIDLEERQPLLDEVDRVLANAPIRGSDFDRLERELTVMFATRSDPAVVSVDSIANLALLHGGDNSALSNSVFAVKRAEILDRDKAGSYIPVCTRNVFLKYYTPSADHQVHFWSGVDREHYLDAVVASLTAYLRPEEAMS